jgi:hypothetical protein
MQKKIDAIAVGLLTSHPFRKKRGMDGVQRFAGE